MYLAQVVFGASADSSNDRESLKNLAESYLAALLKNGQIYGDYLLAWSKGRLVAYTHVARPDSLAAKHHSEWSRSELTKVIEAFGGSPQSVFLDDDLPRHFQNWKQSSSLYLFTHAFDQISPVGCSDTGLPIPLYLLPIDQQVREQIYFWQCAYREHDKIWLGSGALEIPAYRELANPESELAMEGRELCAEVERRTTRPVFYYLHRYWGRNHGEPTRRCPGCGKKWHTRDSDQRNPRQQSFHDFHFRCLKCRLVSHCADSYDDERHARIGEFRTRRKK